MNIKTLCAAAGVAAIAASASGQYLLVVDSGNDRVVALNAADGSVANANYLNIAAAAAAEGYTGGLTPIEALEIGNQIWVTDQVADRIWRFDKFTGAILPSVGANGDLNNVRGMELVGNTVYVTQGSDATNFGEGIVTFDATTGLATGSFAGRPSDDISYFDALFYNNELLVTNTDSGNDGIERYDLAGNFLGVLVSSDGVSSFDFLQQINIKGSNGNIIGGSFSPPDGVYEFTAAGADLGVIAGSPFGPRGVWELPTGEIIYTNGAAIRSDSREILGGSQFRFISAATVPAPATLGLLGGLLAVRRRRA